MLTLRHAADLLRHSTRIAALDPVAAVLGCGASAPLDATALERLGVYDVVQTARIACGPGTLRALLVEASGSRPLREWLPFVAGQLSRNAPHVLWIVIAVSACSGEIAIAAWPGDRRPPRISALVAQRDHITESDAETLRTLGAASGARDILVHSRWVDILGREALGARFYRGLQTMVGGLADSSNVGRQSLRDELALLDTSRLLFLCFLEAKGWLDGNPSFLSSSFDACAASGGRFRTRVLRPLFFGTLNTPKARRTNAALRFGNIPFLNGGLFARTAEERAGRSIIFSDEAYGALIYDLFAQYRFTAAEESAEWNEAAIDPEMLGRAFECLMASRDRRATGAFFTPFALVERTTSFALEDAFMGDRSALARLTLLDPACGSGAFLVHALERVAARLTDLGDDRPLTEVRRDVLTRSIFGVDINPTAVWLCQLRLWLSVVIESTEHDPSRVSPLPNLDRNIRVGDSLAGIDEDAHRLQRMPGVLRLRQRYVRATGTRKRALARELDRLERARAIAGVDARLLSLTERRKDLLAARRGRDLFGDRYTPDGDERRVAAELRRRSMELRALRRRLTSGGALPFSFQTYFADVISRGGFDVIVGNPPWVRPHHIAIAQRAAYRRDFVVARSATWDAGATGAGAGAAFGAQVDVSALFLERSIGLIADRGTIALLVPAKLWRSLAGGGVRRLISDRVTLRRVEDYSEAPSAFDAAVYPSLVVVAGASAPTANRLCVDVAVHHRGHDAFTWRSNRPAFAFDDTPGAPWVILPPDARRAFDLLRSLGPTLSSSAIGRPLLGVKCGCNDAFIVEVLDLSDEYAGVRTADDRLVRVERSLVRPLVRGEQLRRWSVPVHDNAILWTHDVSGMPLASLPPLAAKSFQRWRRELAARSDARRSPRWWTLFRTDGARHDKARVIWADVGREPRASVLLPGDATVPLNSCYVARCPSVHDADALAALLNGPIARAWLDAIAEPARGGYRRYLGWTLALLPTPANWPRAVELLAPVGRAGREGKSPSDRALLEVGAAAYGVSLDDVAPLIAWMTP